MVIYNVPCKGGDWCSFTITILPIWALSSRFNTVSLSLFSSPSFPNSSDSSLSAAGNKLTQSSPLFAPKVITLTCSDYTLLRIWWFLMCWRVFLCALCLNSLRPSSLFHLLNQLEFLCIELEQKGQSFCLS